MTLADPKDGRISETTQPQSDATARSERSLAALEAAFRRKARGAAEEVCRMLATIELDDQNHLGVENHVRLAQMSQLASDISAQLGFFGPSPTADLAGTISRRLERRDGWDTAALHGVIGQAAELRLALGPDEDESNAEPVA